MIRAGSAPVVAARFSRDGRRVLTVSRDGVARTFDARTGKRGADARVRSPLRSHLFSPRGEAVLLVGRGGDARVWRWQAGEPARSTFCRFGPYTSGAVADDGRVALGGGIGLVPGMRPDDVTGELLIVDSRTGVRKTIFVPGGAGSIAFSPGGRFVATAGPETARIWDTLPGRFGRALPVLRGHAAGISDVAFAPDGETVLTASDDGSARLWRAATGEQLAVFRSPTAPTRALFSPSGKRIVTTRRGEVRVWAVDAVPAQFARRLPPMVREPAHRGDHLHAGRVTPRRGDVGAARGRSKPAPGRIQTRVLPSAIPNRDLLGQPRREARCGQLRCSGRC